MLLKELEKFICKTIIIVITLYQKYISPIFPDTCRFLPSCSEYSKSAFKKYGVLKGFYLSAWRILRCNPFCKAGKDPLL
ncbi:MAG: membrane protein insertion efficiency factor YidD [Candidatus Cloacimonetes bacterium]|nr:membrane protein insertion efficiency factor YidD [Candidatus Cloacimonadota bacterium]